MRASVEPPKETPKMAPTGPQEPPKRLQEAPDGPARWQRVVTTKKNGVYKSIDSLHKTDIVPIET